MSKYRLISPHWCNRCGSGGGGYSGQGSGEGTRGAGGDGTNDSGQGSVGQAGWERDRGGRTTLPTLAKGQ